MIIRAPVKPPVPPAASRGSIMRENRRLRLFQGHVCLRTVDFWLDFCRELPVKRSFSDMPPAGFLAFSNYGMLAPYRELLSLSRP